MYDTIIILIIIIIILNYEFYEDGNHDLTKATA